MGSSRTTNSPHTARSVSELRTPFQKRTIMKLWYLHLRFPAVVLAGLACTFLLAQNVYADSHYGGEDDIENPMEGNMEAIEHGRERYSARCAFCHGSRGIGAKGPCLSCGKFKKSGSRNLDIFSVIAGGLTIAGRPTQMGGFSRTLSDEDIWSIISYLRWTYKDRKESGEFEENYNAVLEESKR